MTEIDPRNYSNLFELGKEIFLKEKPNSYLEDLLKAETIYERLEYRYNLCKDSDEPALVSKPNLWSLPFKPEPHPDYPSPWTCVSYKQFFRLVKACAYVLKKRFDLPPQSRVGVVANTLPLNILIIYALWYIRCTPVAVPPKLGNDVKQFWARMLDISMFIYDINVNIFDEEKQNQLNESGEWIWEWEYPLREDEYNLSAGFKGIPMFCMNNSEFLEEIYQCSLEGKTYARPGLKDDVVMVIGTSSSTQAIIKNGHCSKMKFIPVRLIQCGSLFQNILLTRKISLKYSVLASIPSYHMMGFTWIGVHHMNTGGALIFHTQKLHDIGFVPEVLLDDIVETKPGVIPLFPFNYAEIKRLFDEHHPRCEVWEKAIQACPKNCFRTGGAPIGYDLLHWFNQTFKILINNEYGSSETGIMMYKQFDKDLVPGEEGYLTRVPWQYFHFKLIDENNPNEGELFIYNPFAITGYIGRAKKGEFYESAVPGMRCDYEHDNLYETIDGIEYYRTNDIWTRSTISGDYKYVSRVDDILTFATGHKMNPLPFENTMSSECKNIKHCCLLVDNTQYEVVCFVEPEWSEILMEDGTPLDITIDPESLSKEEQRKLKKLAQEQTWNSMYNLLQDNAKSLNNWTKQLTIHNVYIIDYGKQFPVTAKGSVARRVAKLEYSEVLNQMSNLINGKISSIDEAIDDLLKQKQEEKKREEEEEDEGKDKEGKEGKQEEEEVKEVKEKDNSITENEKETNVQTEKETEIVTENKTEEEINEEIQKAVMIVYESIKEIIPSTPDFEDFNINAPFTIYSIDSLATRKLTSVLNRKTLKPFSASTLFNYGTPYDLARYITGYDKKLKEKASPLSSLPKSIKDVSMDKRVAVIGMALRLPGAINNSKSFWMSLAKGRDCVLAPVKDRKLHLGYVDKPSNLLGENEHNIPKCGCYDSRSNAAKPSEFDAEFFNCLPEEVNSMDPRQRWVLETSWEAFENAGIAPNTLENTTTGVFVGVNDDHDYQDLLKENGIAQPISAHSTPSGIAGRLSYFYKLFGPSFTIDTACSTGASALHSACRSLQFGDCDLSVVSGVKYLYSASEFHRTSVARMTSPHGRCATFDKDADGFAPGEGCVTFILKRLEDAVRDGDNILSVILGTSSGQSGLRQSISAPSSDGQVLNLKRALKFAGVDPSEVSFVEAHGTGTPLGDAIEVDALNQVYGGSHTEENPLVIGSVKTNIGHTNEAAGLAGMAKVILAMQHKYIPKNLHFNTLNPEIDIHSIPIQIATKTMPWETQDNKPRIAQVSSFGLQGSIVHIILQEYIPENGKEEDVKKSKDSKEDHILTISAKTPAALNELCESYLNFLEGMEDNEENIEDLCYTSNVGRQHFDYRISAIGKNAHELYDDLEKKMEIFDDDEDNSEAIFKQVASKSNGISQHLEIYSENAGDLQIPKKVYDTVKELLSTENSFKKTFEFCDSEIQKIAEGISLKQMIEEEKNGKESELNNSFFILSFYYSLHQLVESIMIKNNSSKKIYGGFGFGEIISLVLSGGLSFSSAISLIQTATENGSDLSSWFGKQSIPKFQKTVFIPSLEKEFKNGESLSFEDISTIMKRKNEVKKNDYSIFINKYGPKSKDMTLYSMNGDQEIISESPSSLNIIEFFDDGTKKSLFDQFIMNEYENGQNINWKVVNSRVEAETQKACPVHKIELPTYPFQRSTYWPVPLKN
ncbi:hypothetical protein H8356DRAFT_1311429 [Neocallimastix lanati (nom. inval.)]|jgi:3-oxoacyl-(acyl-carrier-protein) synthase/acyl-CoA synthetase (AMP-forming)/AMP-acid ligase II|uniref:Ketoacyl-synt-domain-containing protein n=1 Tax=Neocallimastix californiae TaxID=1754190 RepID=A0A1Y2DRW8_9FUNG|nr:hypothetical protein H8356DRAFT_1311429 [Neocallimastix sp. JGI-2020a]ORY62010.1 ketoacyl-synt-domain-containing protein [Neocallimastix californiae]|eukprot:ORY62010.1 ketoacyl-synt-domain-containing protein [Neocallimastix californiae]